MLFEIMHIIKPLLNEKAGSTFLALSNTEYAVKVRL